MIMRQKPFVRLTTLLLGVFIGQSLAVDGIAVSIKGSAASTKMLSRGSIYKYVVSNNQSDYPGTRIYDGGDATHAVINQSGTKIAFNKKKSQYHSDIVLMDINGGSLTILTETRDNSSVDFPDDNWVYFTENGYWHRVSTTPNSSGEHTVEENILKAPKAAYLSINYDGTQGAAHSYEGCGGSNSARAYGKHSFCKDGCGAGISISGKYMSHNLSSHQVLKIWNVTNGTKVHEFNIHNFGYTAEEHWNSNHFSTNSDEWLTFHQGEGYSQDKGCRQVVYKIDGSVAFEIQPLKSGVYFEGNDFWAGDVGAQPAFISIDQGTLSFSAEAGASNPASQTITVSNGGDGDLGAIEVSENADWLTTSVSNMTITNSVDITGLDGSYSTTVTISAGGAEKDKQYEVYLVVSAPPRLAEISINDKTVAPGETTKFIAVGYDQFGDPFTISSLSWNVSGGGDIADDGTFTAGTTEGVFEVSATAGDVTGVASVTIAQTPSVHLKINCGGNSHDVAGWERDDAYLDPSDNGADYSWSDIETDGVENAAPAGVYTSVHHWDHTYLFPDLADGSYTLRMHMADWSGNRNMTYIADDETILDNFDIVTEAGGKGKALVKDIPITVTGGDGLRLECNGNGGDVFECGLEIFADANVAPAQPITLLSPNGGEVWKTGGTYTVSWTCDTMQISGITVQISTTDGRDWDVISTSGSLPPAEPGTNQGSWTFTLPESIGDASLISNACRIMVHGYTAIDLADASDEAFTIESGLSPTRIHQMQEPMAPSLRIESSIAHVDVTGAHTLSIYALNGTLIKTIRGSGGKRYSVDLSAYGSGGYYLSVSSPDFKKNMVIITP